MPLFVVLVVSNSLIANCLHRLAQLNHLIQKILVCRTQCLQEGDLKSPRRAQETTTLVKYFSFRVS